MSLAYDTQSIVIEELSEAETSAEAKQKREQFARNAAWFQAHAGEIVSKHRGKCICIAGQTLFVADTPHDALKLAIAAHPHDRGRFVHYIPKDRVPRVYAN